VDALFSLLKAGAMLHVPAGAHEVNKSAAAKGAELAAFFGTISKQVLSPVKFRLKGSVVSIIFSKPLPCGSALLPGPQPAGANHIDAANS